ncbi:MAG: radical SAM/SPASM domain-containing protein [Acidobacteriota bacterium]
MTVALRPVAAHTLLPDPFLHVGDDRIYSPLRDCTLAEGDPLYAPLRSVLSGQSGVEVLDEAVRSQLESDGWLVNDPNALAHETRLKYVSLETHTVCNQRCFFCPVSFEQRAAHFMPTDFFESIVLQLSAYRSTIEGVWLMLYNEPSLDKRMVEQAATLRHAGLPPVINTNASAFHPKKTDALIEAGGLRLLSVNISTFDRDSYARDRGADQLDRVLRNLDYMANKPVAEEMLLMVLGQKDEDHERQIEAARKRYGDTRFVIQHDEIMDRAGWLEVGRKAKREGGRLAGCENVGSRPLQHMHITPHGKVVFCCQDYDETHVVGDLRQDSVAEVLAGEALASLRRQAYGLEEPHDDFMCSSCVFALRDFGAEEPQP